MPKIKYKFSGHQTFVFRYGWLEKGVQLIKNNHRGFLEDDALVRLGVGKNMVESIKYWCLQTDLITDAGNGSMQLTKLGKLIFGATKNEDGYDPFLEDDATLWLIHWSLLQKALPPENNWSSWHFAFYRWHKQEFSKQDMVQAIRAWTLNQCSVTDATLTRDVDCMVRNYAGIKGKSIEDNFDSPFLSLELIQGTSHQEMFKFNIGSKQHLPVHIVGYAILHFMNERTSLNVQNCLYDIGSPGQIFKLNEAALIDYILELESITQRTILLSDTAGLNTVNFANKRIAPRRYAEHLLAQYYERGT